MRYIIIILVFFVYNNAHSQIRDFQIKGGASVDSFYILATDTVDASTKKGLGKWFTARSLMTLIGSEVDTLYDYTDLRAYTGNSSAVKVQKAGIEGLFIQVSSGTDDGGIIIVGSDSRIWERIYDAESGADVKWYGAVGDSIANDLPAIWACLANNDHVFFSPGRYLCDTFTVHTLCEFNEVKILVDRNKTTFTGRDATLYNGTEGDSVGLAMIFIIADSCDISGINLYTTQYKESQMGIRNYGSHNYIHDLSIDGFDWGIFQSRPYNYHLDTIVRERCFYEHLSIKNWGKSHGIEINGAIENTITNCQFHGNRDQLDLGNAIELYWNWDSIRTPRSYDNVITNNIIRVAACGVTMWGDSSAIVTNNIIDSVWRYGIVSATAIFPVIDSTANWNSIISNNIITNVNFQHDSTISCAGILMNFGSTGLSVIGNTIKNIWGYAPSGGGCGIQVYAYSFRNTISNNNIAGTMWDGILVNGDYNTITANTISDAGILRVQTNSAVRGITLSGDWNTATANVLIDTASKCDIMLYMPGDNNYGVSNSILGGAGVSIQYSSGVDNILVQRNGTELLNTQINGSFSIRDAVAGAATDSVLVWTAATGRVKMRNAASFGGSGATDLSIAQSGATQVIQSSTGTDVGVRNLYGLLITEGATDTLHFRVDSSLLATTYDITQIPISSLKAAAATNTINNANYAQTWQWNTLSSNTGLALSSTSTAAASNTHKLFSLDLSGTNGTSAQSTYGAYISNTHAGTTSTNYGLFSTATGGTTTNYAVYGSASGANGYGIYGTSTSNVGVYGIGTTGVQGQTTSGIGVYAIATNGIAVSTSATSGTGFESIVTTGTPMYLQDAVAGTNTVENMINVTHLTTGTAAAGIGANIEYNIEVSDGNTYAANTLTSKWSTATAASRVSQFIISGVNAAVTADLFTIEGSGKIRLNKYGVGSFTAGTPTADLFVDASGNIIEGSMTGQSWTIDADDADTELISNQTVKFAGTGGIVTDWLPSTNILEIDGSALSDGNGIYDGDGTTPTDTDVTVTDSLEFNGTVKIINDANDYVGIGAQSPAAKLHVKSTTGADFILEETGGTALIETRAISGGVESPFQLKVFNKDLNIDVTGDNYQMGNITFSKASASVPGGAINFNVGYDSLNLDGVLTLKSRESGATDGLVNVAGGLRFKWASSANSAVTMNTGDYGLTMTATGAKTVTLPDAVSGIVGQELMVFNNGASGDVTIAITGGSGDTINGDPTLLINESCKIICVATNEWIINN